MSDFERAVALTHEHEGGYANRRNDRGGPTNMGITLRTLSHALGTAADLNHDGHIDAEDVKLLTREQADAIYREWYWTRPGLDHIRDDRIAAKTFDFGVNAGPHAAVALLQRAIDHAAPPGVAHVVDDGVLGPKTLASLAACDPDLVLAAYASEQALFYLRCIEVDPRLAEFRANWLARARWIPSSRSLA